MGGRRGEMERNNNFDKKSLFFIFHKKICTFFVALLFSICHVQGVYVHVCFVPRKIELLCGDHQIGFFVCGERGFWLLLLGTWFCCLFLFLLVYFGLVFYKIVYISHSLVHHQHQHVWCRCFLSSSSPVSISNHRRFDVMLFAWVV